MLLLTWDACGSRRRTTQREHFPRGDEKRSRWRPRDSRASRLRLLRLRRGERLSSRKEKKIRPHAFCMRGAVLSIPLLWSKIAPGRYDLNKRASGTVRSRRVAFNLNRDPAVTNKLLALRTLRNLFAPPEQTNFHTRTLSTVIYLRHSRRRINLWYVHQSGRMLAREPRHHEYSSNPSTRVNTTFTYESHVSSSYNFWRI